MDFIIHTCSDREWYVDEFLIPSMLEQGIDPNDITVWIDRLKNGCLESCMQSWKSLPLQGHTWHLQDDVIIARDFYKRVEEWEHFEGIVCGLCTNYDKDRKHFCNQVSTNLTQIWFSFPCIRIPNKLAKKCAMYFYSTTEYDKWKNWKRGDDSVFRDYLKKHTTGVKYINLNPNLVDHIDYLLGGSTNNKKGKISKPAESLYFPDRELVGELTKKIRSRQK